MLGADAIASGIKLCFHVSRSEMDVAGGRVDMSVTEQRLHHREIHPRLGQRGPESVPQRVRMPTDDPGEPTVIAEDRAQPRSGKRLAAVWSVLARVRWESYQAYPAPVRAQWCDDLHRLLRRIDLQRGWLTAVRALNRNVQLKSKSRSTRRG